MCSVGPIALVSRRSLTMAEKLQKQQGRSGGGRKGVLMRGIRDVFGMMQREQQRVLELKE